MALQTAARADSHTTIDANQAASAVRPTRNALADPFAMRS